MAQKRAPHKVGDRVAIMYDHRLAPGIVLKVEQGSSGSWRGDVRTSDGVLENRSLHRDYVMKQSALEPSTREIWGPYWEGLEKENADV